MKQFKLISDRVEIASLDASVMKGIDTFNIFSYATKFMKDHDYTNRSEYAYEVDYDNFIVHIYAITMREVEL